MNATEALQWMTLAATVERRLEGGRADLQAWIVVNLDV